MTSKFIKVSDPTRSNEEFYVCKDDISCVRHFDLKRKNVNCVVWLKSGIKYCDIRSVEQFMEELEPTIKGKKNDK